MRRLARPLLLGGTAAIVVGLSNVHAHAHGYAYIHSFRFSWSLTYIALLAVSAYGAGLPDLPRTRRAALLAAVGSTGVAALGISVVQLVLGSGVLPRSVIFGTPVILIPFTLLCATLARDGTARDSSRERILAVAGLDEGSHLRDELDARPEKPAVLTRVLSPGDATVATTGERPLIDAVAETGATTVVLDRAAQGDSSIVAQAAELHEAGIRIRTLSLFYEQWLGKLPLSELERVSLLFDIGEIHRGTRYGRTKRVIDVLVAIVGLVALAAAVPVVSVGNLVGNRGPLFYRQPRVGKGGREFQILKFRSMRPGHAGNEWTSNGDPRVTAFGAWLRRSHLDELPQMVNILRGDLSLVGPRPEQLHYVDELAGKVPFYRLRHLVRPGLTGWAQVKYPYGASDLDALEKLQYEFFYLRHQGLALDLRIVVRTIRSVVGRGGR